MQTRSYSTTYEPNVNLALLLLPQQTSKSITINIVLFYHEWTLFNVWPHPVWFYYRESICMWSSGCLVIHIEHLSCQYNTIDHRISLYIYSISFFMFLPIVHKFWTQPDDIQIERTHACVYASEQWILFISSMKYSEMSSPPWPSPTSPSSNNQQHWVKYIFRTWIYVNAKSKK